jgi:hypothetical protein
MNDRLRESGAGHAGQPIFIMSKEIKFPAPDGFTAPEDADPTKPFEVMASVTMGEDGMLSLTAIDGVPIASESEEMDGGMEDEMEDDAPMGDGFLVAIEKGASKGGVKS